MTFMQKQITDRRTWYSVEGTHGTEFFDAEDFTLQGARENYSGHEINVYTVDTVIGYGARLSAPGYLDCTEWTVFDSVSEAEDYLAEFHGDEDSNDTE